DELWYEADEGQIKQIVWNLATNGLRAMPTGGCLRLTGSVETAPDAVVISVEDQGVGIPAEELDKLFQPFHGSFAKGSGLRLAIVLRREGYEVLLAENGESAVDTLERESVDLLISDIKMPDLSGVEVLRAAKKIDQDILGIMITAFASTDSAVEAMRLGACDY